MIKKRLKRIYASIVLFLIMGVFLLPNTSFAKAINDENIIQITNKVRTKEGLKTLTANQLLSKAAYDKAEVIFSKQIFEHNIDGKKFSSWIKDTGYKYQSVGENLAIDFVSSESTMKAWLNSPSHKKNILNPSFQEIGVAVKKDKFEGHDSILVVQIFGTPITANETILKNANGKTPPINTEQEALLTNSAPKTLLVANTKSGITIGNIPEYTNNFHTLETQEYLSMKFVEEAVLYVIDHSNSYLINYYFSIITLLLLVFFTFFVRHKRNNNF